MHTRKIIEECGLEGCYKICLSCKLHHPELCCMASENEFKEDAEKYCLLPKFVCGYINRGKQYESISQQSKGSS